MDPPLFFSANFFFTSIKLAELLFRLLSLSLSCPFWGPSISNALNLLGRVEKFFYFRRGVNCILVRPKCSYLPIGTPLRPMARTSWAGHMCSDIYNAHGDTCASVKSHPPNRINGIIRATEIAAQICSQIVPLQMRRQADYGLVRAHEKSRSMPPTSYCPFVPSFLESLRWLFFHLCLRLEQCVPLSIVAKLNISFGKSLIETWIFKSVSYRSSLASLLNIAIRDESTRFSAPLYFRSVFFFFFSVR